MNLTRQYKLHKLGVDVSGLAKEAIVFAEKMISKLVVFQSEEHPSSIFYLDEKGKVFLEKNDNVAICLFFGFWLRINVITDTYSPDLDTFLKYFFSRNLNIDFQDVRCVSTMESIKWVSIQMLYKYKNEHN